MQQNTSQAQDSCSRNSRTSSESNLEQLEAATAFVHRRGESSTSDEFGSFVSVSAAEDPLGAGSVDTGPISPTTVSIFDVFAGDARKRAEENGKRVLDELRAHDEDPLAWLNSGGTRTASDNKQEKRADSLVEELSTSGNEESTTLGLVQDSTELIALDDAGSMPLDTSTKGSPSSYSGLHPGPSSEDTDLLPSNKKRDSPPSSVLPSSSVSSLSLIDGPLERAQRHEKRVLDELLAHDQDPLTWLKSKADDDSTMSAALREAGSTLIDLNAPSSEVQEPPPHSRTPSVTSSQEASSLQRPSIPRTTSTPLIPRSSERARSQSPTNRPPVSPSTGSTVGLPRSWMSTLGLFSAPRPVPASSSPSAARGTHDAPVDAGSAGMSPTQSSLHALFGKAGPPSPKTRRHARFATEGHPPMHSATMPLPSSSSLTSDASPFASHVYIPPSGAPGFTGDHNWNPGGFEFDTQKRTSGKDVRLVGRNEVTVTVLSSAIANALRPHLPPLPRLAQAWKLLYSADQHGLSLNTLYARCAPPVIVGGGGLVPGANTGALVAVQDAEGGVFGAWIPEGVHLSHGSYYGGGDSFLWSAERKDVESEDNIRVYKWTGRNGYVAYCDTDGFSFGGGEGHYGLYVDANLVQGTTHPCPTFDNECLAHGEWKGRMVAFDAVGLEVWSIGS